MLRTLCKVDRFKPSSKMTKTTKNEGAKIRLSHRDKSRNSPDLGFYNVGRDRFTLAFRSLNQAVLEQILGWKRAENEQWLGSKLAQSGGLRCSHERALY
jgi:hypothetical protein